MYTVINKLKEKRVFDRVAEIRKENTHDISRHWKMVNKLTKAKRNNEYFKFDLELKPFISDIILNVESIYKVLENVIIIMQDRMTKEDFSITVPNII